MEESSSLEERMAKVEGILEQVSQRLNGVEARLNHLETRMDSLDVRMDSLENRMDSGFSELRREMRSNFRWTLGITIAAWVTIIAAILGLIFTL